MSANRTAIVLGAGAVGMCCALSMLERGLQVTLIDRKGVAAETSYGNAGVVATNAILPVLKASDLGALPSFALGLSPKFAYSPLYAMANARAISLMVKFATRAHAKRAAAALGPLVRCSAAAYRKLASANSLQDLLRDGGWFHLYRSQSEFERSKPEIELLAENGVDLQCLSKNEIYDFEPHMKPVFQAGVWYKDALVCSNPGKLLEKCADLFIDGGGQLRQQTATGYLSARDGCKVFFSDGETDRCDILVIALGAWSRGLRQLANVPLLAERGYHDHFAPAADAGLARPFMDVERGYVINPMQQGLRITTGTELNFPDARPSPGQLKQAARAAGEAFPLGQRRGLPQWMGRRPTLPDSLPMIGFAGKERNVILAFGHQHIGLSTAPGTGEAVASLATNAKPPFDLGPFDPARFGTKVG